MNLDLILDDIGLGQSIMVSASLPVCRVLMALVVSVRLGFVKPMFMMMPWWLVSGLSFVQNLVEVVLVLFLRSDSLHAVCGVR